MWESTVVQLLSHAWLFVTPWTVTHQASLSFTTSWSLLKLMFIESVMPSNHLVLCHPLLLQSSTFPRIRVFSNESVLHIRWPKYWRFNCNISATNEHSGFISFRISSKYFYKTMLKWKNLNMVENHEMSWREIGQRYSKTDIHNNTTSTFV